MWKYIKSGGGEKGKVNNRQLHIHNPGSDSSSMSIIRGSASSSEGSSSSLADPASIANIPSFPGEKLTQFCCLKNNVKIQKTFPQ